MQVEDHSEQRMRWSLEEVPLLHHDLLINPVKEGVSYDEAAAR
jgi:hypothetical protein